MSEKDAAEVEVAYKLFIHICEAEGILDESTPPKIKLRYQSADWILSTFAKCIAVTRQPTQPLF